MIAPRTAAATAARKTAAIRRRLASHAAELRHHGFIVITRTAACPACKRVDDSSTHTR